MEQIAIVSVALIVASCWVEWGWWRMHTDRRRKKTKANRLPKELSIPEMLKKVNDHPSKNGQHNYPKTGTDA